MTQQKFSLNAPFAKVNPTEDGGREVWGFATLEVVDKSGEIADADGTIKAFEKWAGDAEKRSGGKSKGNIRVMHQSIVGGKAIHWEPQEAQDENGQAIKGVWLGSYVPPTKTDVIKDIDEGILTGYSIGGKYEKRWYDDNAKAFRFIPELAEVSFVDNPCVPGADFAQVITKAVPSASYDSEELKKDLAFIETVTVMKEQNELKCPHCEKFIGEKEIFHDGENFFHSVCKDAGPIFFKSVTSTGERSVVPGDDGSVEALQERLNQACNEAYAGIGRTWWDGYIVRTFPTQNKIIIRDYSKDKYFEVPYEDADGKITLGQPIEVARVETYVTVDALKTLETEFLQKRAEQEESEKVNKDAEHILKAAQAAGITPEQAASFFEALSKKEPDQPPTTETPPKKDGDGDTDNNNPEPEPVTQKSAGTTEPGPDPEDGADKALLADILKSLHLETDKLEKAGAAIGKTRRNHLLHAAGHIQAALSGGQYGPEHHLEVEGKGGGGNTGEESPEATEKLIASALQKGVGVFVSEELPKAFEPLVKGLATGADLTKALDAVSKVAEKMNAIETMVKAIHDTPMPGGPVLGEGSPDVAALLKGSGAGINIASLEAQVIQDIIAKTTDPMVKDHLGREMALRIAKGEIHA